MHWILQENLFKDAGSQTILNTLKRFNIPYSIHEVAPSVGELIPAPELDTTNVICMGSYALRHTAKKYGWIPGVFDLEPFNFTVQLEQWGKHMLNHDSRVMKFSEAAFNNHNELFIRPIEDSKSFDGKIYDKYEFEHWQKQVCESHNKFAVKLKDSHIQLAVPKKIFNEYRLFVVNGKIITASLYKLGNTVHYDEMKLGVGNPVEEYAEARIREWQPLKAFVIDVADTSEGFKIVEINTINSCGFYSCDIQKLVMTLEDAFNKNKS